MPVPTEINEPIPTTVGEVAEQLGNTPEYRDQTPREEFANTLSHGIGLLGALAATPVLIVTAVYSGDVTRVVAASVFGGTMILLYLCSTLYHGLPNGRLRQFFLIMDFSAIFLFIAGSYTPFTLCAMGGPWGWSIFGVVWGLALAGIIMKVLCGERYPRFSICLYLLMGWLSLVAIYPLWYAIEIRGLVCLFTGGFFYTAGVAYFLTSHKTYYNHLRWHLFVLLGTACHFLAVWGYVIS